MATRLLTEPCSQTNTIPVGGRGRVAVTLWAVAGVANIVVTLHSTSEMEIERMRPDAVRSGPALQVGQIEGAAQPAREPLRIVIRPEVHEEEVWRVIDHVAM